MTVKELIEKLQELDASLPVMIYKEGSTVNTGGWSEVDNVRIEHSPTRLVEILF